MSLFAGGSLAWRMLLGFGRWFEPFTVDEVPVVSRAFGRMAHTSPELAEYVWRELTPAERRVLQRWKDQEIKKSPEDRVREACSRQT